MDNIIAFTAEYLFIIVVGLAVLYILYMVLRRRASLLEAIIALVVIGGTSYLLSKLGTNLVSSPRPFVETGVPPLISSATDNGFPSDHTLLLATVAAVVTIVDRRVGFVLWLIALLIGLARVYARVHHLLDVIGSFGMVLIAVLIYLAVRKLWQTYAQPRLTKASSNNPDS